MANNPALIYYYYVRASNSAGYSPPSVIVDSRGGVHPPPSPAYGSCCLPMDSTGFQGNGGAGDGDPVNLATGGESYTPDPDITVYNPDGPGVSWQRRYDSYQALRGYASPGLSVGWSHTYDVTLQGPTTTGAWGALKIVYPNGADETLTPQLTTGGAPTGDFNTPPGAPYLVHGVPSGAVGRWQSVTITWKDQTQQRFTLLSTNGNVYVLSQLTNRVGRSINFSWNSGDRTLAQITDASSGTALLNFNYQGGQLASVTDAYGRRVVYTYEVPYGSAPGRLQSVSQVGDVGTTPPARWSYTYALNNGQQLNSITVPSPSGNGNSTAAINYDDRGRVTSLVDGNGNRRVYTYGTTSTQVQVKDAANTTVATWAQNYTLDARNTGVMDANNKSTVREYNDAANPLKATRVVDKNGKATTFTYDQRGSVLTVTSPRNVTTTYTYDYTAFPLGRLTSVKEGSKPATTFTYYEPSGLVHTVTSPSPTGSGTVTASYTYDEMGNVLTATGPGNNAASQITTTLSYTTDGAFTQPAKTGQPLTVTDNLGHTSHRRYDAQGRVTSEKDAQGFETNVSYNVAGQVDTVTLPATGQTGTGRARSVSTYLYPGGPLATSTAFNESGVQAQQVSYTYGPEGETLSVAGSVEPVTYAYDALYRLKTLKDGNNNQTTYAYNSVGDLTRVQMPGGETTQFPLHDANGQTLRRIDGNGVTTNYVYDDAENQLTDIQYPATPTLNVHLGYD
ncbi:MAG: DUF6531 domain-containing protein, partial [Acidobacteria bacterium]|nr:DUF6531 domain-containing protein [Acidobacteriota bacterium]